MTSTSRATDPATLLAEHLPRDLSRTARTRARLVL